jgi:hypothetical protein
MQANRLAFFICKPYDLLFDKASHMACVMATMHAVITGDLIDSTRRTPGQVDEAMALIEACVARLSDDARFHRYRGDGWQAYVGAAGQGLSALVLIAAHLRATDALSSRMALGLGDAHGLDQGSLGMAGGTAFIHSGRALDGIGDGKWLAIAGQGIDPLHTSLMSYVDAQVRGWSQEQAEAVALSLDLDGAFYQQVLATRLGISRQAFAARLNAGGFRLVDEAIQAFGRHFSQEVHLG